ncbi:MAG: hypothetical protein ACRDRA_13295 [Pseudonocardiaceae bacterium]
MCRACLDEIIRAPNRLRICAMIWLVTVRDATVGEWAVRWPGIPLGIGAGLAAVEGAHTVGWRYLKGGQRLG